MRLSWTVLMIHSFFSVRFIADSVRLIVKILKKL